MCIVRKLLQVITDPGFPFVLYTIPLALLYIKDMWLQKTEQSLKEEKEKRKYTTKVGVAIS